MAKTIIDGGIHVSINIRLDHEQIANMPPAVITALMSGIASICTAHQYALATASPHPTPDHD